MIYPYDVMTHLATLLNKDDNRDFIFEGGSATGFAVLVREGASGEFVRFFVRIEKEENQGD